MDHIEVANLAGVNLGDLDWLLAGMGSANIAERLKVNIGDIEDFIRGVATKTMTDRLGLNTISAAEELAKCAGREGAIGIIIGLLIS